MSEVRLKRRVKAADCQDTSKKAKTQTSDLQCFLCCEEVFYPIIIHCRKHFCCKACYLELVLAKVTEGTFRQDQDFHYCECAKPFHIPGVFYKPEVFEPLHQMIMAGKTSEQISLQADRLSAVEAKMARIAYFCLPLQDKRRADEFSQTVSMGFKVDMLYDEKNYRLLRHLSEERIPIMISESSADGAMLWHVDRVLVHHYPDETEDPGDFTVSLSPFRWIHKPRLSPQCRVFVSEPKSRLCVAQAGRDITRAEMVALFDFMTNVRRVSQQFSTGNPLIMICDEFNAIQSNLFTKGSTIDMIQVANDLMRRCHIAFLLDFEWFPEEHARIVSWYTFADAMNPLLTLHENLLSGSSTMLSLERIVDHLQVMNKTVSLVCENLL